MTAGVGTDGLMEVRRPEVGPEHVGDEQFRVGDLPEQIVADPHLAGRPN